MRFLTGKLFMFGVLGTVIALFPADGLRAMGLGEARVDSYLGQTLDVTIRLVEADSAALDSLTVAPATARDYERLGVSAEALALGLEVTVDRRVNPPVLRVRSRRAVTDPVMQFMVDARWSGGRLLREYTLFLDPPTLAVAPPVTRAEPERPPISEPAQQPEPAPRAEPRPRAPAAAPSEPAPRAEPRQEPQPPRETRPSDGPAVIGPVGSGETLWAIAYGWRPDTSLTMNQVMLAIFDRNPQAFIGDNVNRLRRGAELTMPSLDEVRSVSAAEADRRIRDQMQAWQQGTTARQVPVVAEAAVPEVEVEAPAPSPEPAAGESPDVVHRLEVVPPESDVFDEGPAVSEGEIRRTSGRLSELEDQMYAEELERDDLLRQIDSIRDAIETREAAGLAVADEELAVLEGRLREAREARAASDRAVADVDDDDVSAYFRQLEDEMGLGTEDEAVAADPAVVDVDETAVDAAPVTEAEPMPVARTGADRDLPLWVWLAAGLVLLLGAGVLMLVLRRRSGERTAAGAGTARGDVSAARARVAASPTNLAAHLALLEALGAKDDTAGFSNALDDMYHQVDSDENPHWQDALNLAVLHAPNHPLLTPNETAIAGDDDEAEGLDDRTREMLGILGADESVSDKPGEASPDDYEIDSDLQPDDEQNPFGASDDGEFTSSTEVPADGPELGEEDDFDLAAISNRLDRERGAGTEGDESSEPETDSEDEDLSLDLDEDDILALPTEDSEIVADQDGDEAEDGLDLDFKFSDSKPAASADGDDAVEDDDELARDIEALGLDAGQDSTEPDEPEFGQAEPEADPDREIENFLRPESERPGEAEQSADETDTESSPEQGEPQLSDEDAEVKLDLARAYLSMDDPDSARTLLEEITSGGSSAMRAQARKLLVDI